TQSYCIKDNYITVINDAPVVVSEQDTLDIRKNTVTEFNLWSLFSDPNEDPLTFSWEGNSAQLNITARNDSIIDIQPGSDYLGVETVTFIATDNEGDTVSHRMDIWVSETAINNMLPQKFHCEQNYPNPFNPTTIISYQLPEVCDVHLDIYTASGRKLTSLVNVNQSAGYYRVTWDASGLPSGLYFYRISAGNYVKAHKMILMK
ncbi:MAG: T9SS type A sorting domain-containing protein, partial [Candidatus Marinimicrobia bacterium]|nr:T9SS type A sorting domain-containing protein [Candidatus Neomarinimicrobiota bacterium]